MDVSQAYRNVPVHPADRYLLGMEWEGRVYVDGTLPFGLRSVPLLFTAKMPCSGVWNKQEWTILSL